MRIDTGQDRSQGSSMSTTPTLRNKIGIGRTVTTAITGTTKTADLIESGGVAEIASTVERSHLEKFIRKMSTTMIAGLVAVVSLICLTGTSSAVANTDRLNTNEQLNSGERLVSSDGRYAMVMQGDGNLVIYGPSGPTWSSNTVGSGGTKVIMQGDGNLVIYTASGTPVFATGTRGSNAALVMQNDSNLVIYASSGAVWASNNSYERAIQWFYNHIGNTGYEGKCELAVENSFGTNGRYPTARANWNARGQNFPYTSAPRGALVFYNTSAAGHVAVSLGNGRVISTSAGGRIGIEPISYFQNPLGWAWAPW